MHISASGPYTTPPPGLLPPGRSAQKLRQQLLCMFQISLWNPTILPIVISLPMNQELTLTTNNSRI